MKDFSFVTNSHPAYIESLYRDFLKDPRSVDPEWVKFFEGFDFAVSNLNGKTGATPVKIEGTVVSGSQLTKEFAVFQLIQAYRAKGHLMAKTNPIRERKDRHANLGLEHFGLGEADLQTEFYAGSFLGLGMATLQNILDFLNKCYTSSIGVEY
ncbi:MAG TPA: 2-oxoglutarate dehydrogenase E1 component, partial [Chitinophagaceae bacterium]